MLISPPFLSAQTPQSGAVNVDEMMLGAAPGQGSFPLSFQLGWHGGLHLTVPAQDEAGAMVRAIADGTVKYVRKPRLECRDNDPLNYYAGWTSDGVVAAARPARERRTASFSGYSS